MVIYWTISFIDLSVSSKQKSDIFNKKTEKEKKTIIGNIREYECMGGWHWQIMEWTWSERTFNELGSYKDISIN